MVHCRLFLFGNQRNQIPNANTITEPYQNQQRRKIAAKIVSSSHKIQTPPSRTLKPRNGQHKKKKKAALCEWASMPDLMPHIQPLLKCFQKPPDVSVSRVKVFEVL
jgi:hypothetical protein